MCGSFLTKPVCQHGHCIKKPRWPCSQPWTRCNLQLRPSYSQVRGTFRKERAPWQAAIIVVTVRDVILPLLAAPAVAELRLCTLMWCPFISRTFTKVFFFFFPFFLIGFY